ncbi:hypothetical protein BV25DRAFT_281955 [Artomyces pyxidatus]|uniref:Uncharacterized protein n=1 Tax=Artomyces pyxidatus TaxID=48021 RepID=A0ACB8T873_9AGAM|nr:hypothetical protein BV25DRAFT_281955 [Artomyces pyxidatus]
MGVISFKRIRRAVHSLCASAGLRGKRITLPAPCFFLRTYGYTPDGTGPRFVFYRFRFLAFSLFSPRIAREVHAYTYMLTIRLVNHAVTPYSSVCAATYIRFRLRSSCSQDSRVVSQMPHDPVVTTSATPAPAYATRAITVQKQWSITLSPDVCLHLMTSVV